MRQLIYIDLVKPVCQPSQAIYRAVAQPVTGLRQRRRNALRWSPDYGRKRR
jgi:hypothetical protein